MLHQLIEVFVQFFDLWALSLLCVILIRLLFLGYLKAEIYSIRGMLLSMQVDVYMLIRHFKQDNCLSSFCGPCLWICYWWSKEQIGFNNATCGWVLIGSGPNTGKTVAIILGGAAGVGFLVIFLLFARGLLKKKDGKNISLFWCIFNLVMTVFQFVQIIEINWFVQGMWRLGLIGHCQEDCCIYRVIIIGR